MNIGELRIRSNAFVRNMDLWIAKAVQDNKKPIVDLNIEQMHSSKLSTGQPISPPYSDAYAKKKGFSKPNLKLKGNFQGKMRLKTNKSIYSIDSSDFKSNFLSSPRTEKNKAGYGKDIFGLMKKNKKTASKPVSKSLFESYQDKVLKFA